MLETLFNLVKQNAGDAIINNPAIPNEHNDSAMQTVMSSVMGGLQQQAGGGNLGGLMSLLGGGQGAGGLGSNPIVGGMVQSAVGGLMQKFGISNSAAAGIASSLIPMVMSQLINKANDPNDSSVDVGSIVGQATNPPSGGFDFGSLMSSGSAAMSDGKLDMGDIMNIAGGLFGGRK